MAYNTLRAMLESQRRENEKKHIPLTRRGLVTFLLGAGIVFVTGMGRKTGGRGSLRKGQQKDIRKKGWEGRGISCFLATALDKTVSTTLNGPNQ